MIEKENKSLTSKRIPSLDGLRGVAIILVLIGHGSYSIPQSFLSHLFVFVGNGHLGVSIFFVLSGYLIYTLSIQEVQKTGTFNWKNFYFRRILRIFPALYFALFIVTLLTIFKVLTLTIPILLTTATFTSNYSSLWIKSTEYPDYFVIGQYWTVSLEEQFYLVFPLLIILFRKNQLLPVLIGVILFEPFVRVACYFLMPDLRGQLGTMLHTNFDSISAGVLLGELLRQDTLKDRLIRLANNKYILISSIVFLVFISPILSIHYKGIYLMTFGKTLELIGISIVITAAISNRKTLMFDILNSKLLSYIGVISYSLYLWNNLFLYSDGSMIVNKFPLNFICTFGMGIFSYYLIEKPFLRIKDRLKKQKF